MRSPFMLNTDWYDATLKEWLAPNCVAEAGKDFGFDGDEVRLAIAQAALREGKQIKDWKVAAEIGAAAGKIDEKKLLEHAQTPGGGGAGARFHCGVSRATNQSTAFVRD